MKLIASNQLTLTNLLERAETRRETLYKLTNSADVPTAPSGNRNLIIKSTAQTGSRLGIDAILVNDSNHMLTDWIKIEPNTTYTLTTYEDVTETNMYYSLAWYSTNNSDYSGWISRPTGPATAAYLKGGKQYTSPSNAAYAKISYPKNYSKVKLERGSAATSYSAAPEDFGWYQTALVPTQEQRYLWKFEYVYYSDGSVLVTQPVNLSIAGQNGAQGLQGPQGIQGPQGPDGRTQYTHIAYADDANGSGFSQTSQGKTYIGMYQDFESVDSSDPTKYRWSKWKGDQGAPGTPGADGKTSYFHMAYADSANGTTGFSFTESGQQYQGYYTDFTQANSTDPTKYTWIDRRAGVSVGGRNLIIRSQIQKGYIDNTGNLVNTNDHFTTGFIDGTNNKQFTITAPKFVAGGISNYRLVKYDTNKIFLAREVFSYDSNNSKTIKTIILDSNVAYFKISFDGVYGDPFKIERGNIATDYSQAPEDTQADINNKADELITQDQLNALKEQSELHQKELDAKADLNTIEKWYQEYLDYVNIDNDNREKSEAALLAISERVASVVNDLGETKERWNFIDTYMDVANEGLVIGKQDGSANIKISNDRISMFSNGDEVMWISQNMLHIANGVFVQTLQIGNFRFESLDENGEILGLRYLGG